MPQFKGEAHFTHGTPPKIGVLVTNLGSPDETSPSAVRRYLAEFLMDPRVVELPRLLWRIIMHGFILRFRPRRSAKAYEKVWTDEGSPLIVISKQQSASLHELLRRKYGANVVVELAMRYGNPSIASALERLRQQNARQLLVLPLYPQYSAVTSASTFDALAKDLMRTRWIPELRMLTQYHDHPLYIKALADSVSAHWRSNGRAEKLLMSFHGVPRKYLLKGDPYHCQCHKTARLVAENLGLADDMWSISFQSRLGKEEWLRPYTADVLEQWAQQKIKKIDTICPGFSADCVETLEEVILEYGTLFKELGGEELRYIPCLNASEPHIEFLAKLCDDNLHPWLENMQQLSDKELLLSQQRARALGATQ